VICHPKLVETGLDLLDFPTIIFYESGYSLHTLRQASRRSWRIGQRRPVRVKFLCSEGTMQTSCLRLMGKKLLVALTMEGKFAGEGLQSIDQDDDMLSAWRESWWRGMALAILPTPCGEPSVQNIKSYSRGLLIATMTTHPSKCPVFCLTLSPTLWSCGRRHGHRVYRRLRTAPQSLSGKKRRARSVVPSRRRYSA